MAPSIQYHPVKFEKLLVQHEDLKIFKPELFFGAGDDWYYLGPTAVTPEVGDQMGLVVKALIPDALAEIDDWEPVFIDIEGAKFSTWRGVAPEGYVAIGNFFVNGIEKPSPNQTAGIKAIRRDLISEREPDRQIWAKQIPFAFVSLWDRVSSVKLHVATGAFVSKPGEGSVGLLIGLLISNAAVQKA